jgi:uncharacterized protein YjiS (DUF1127 family)
MEGTMLRTLYAVGGRIDTTRRPTTLLDAVARWYYRASSRRQLAALDDRLLRDIGLSRRDMIAEARKPFWQA